MASATGLRPPEGKGEVGIWRMAPDSELISKTSIWPFRLLVEMALELATKTKSVVFEPQAASNPAAPRLTAEANSNWLDLLNFMRIFRPQAVTYGLYKNQVWQRIPGRAQKKLCPAFGGVLENSEKPPWSGG